MTINLIDVTPSGHIQIREKVDGQSRRRVVTSEMDLSNEEQIIQDIAAKITFNDSVPDDGEHKYIKNARLDPATGDMVLTPATMTVVDGEIVSIVKHPAYAVDILDDETTDTNVVELKKLVHTRTIKTRERARRKKIAEEIAAEKAAELAEQEAAAAREEARQAAVAQAAEEEAARLAFIAANPPIEYEEEEFQVIEQEERGDKIVLITRTRKRFKTKLVPIFKEDEITPVLDGNGVQKLARVKVRKVS